MKSGIKWSWSSSDYYPNFGLKLLKRSMKTLLGISGKPTEIRLVTSRTLTDSASTPCCMIVVWKSQIYVCNILVFRACHSEMTAPFCSLQVWWNLRNLRLLPVIQQSRVSFYNKNFLWSLPFDIYRISHISACNMAPFFKTKLFFTQSYV
jgi:hypothetical protein